MLKHLDANTNQIKHTQKQNNNTTSSQDKNIKNRQQNLDDD